MTAMKAVEGQLLDRIERHLRLHGDKTHALERAIGYPGSWRPAGVVEVAAELGLLEE